MICAGEGSVFCTWQGCDCCDYKEDCGRWFQRWLQKSFSSSCPFILCEQPLPSRDGVYFPSSSIWVALWLPLTTRMWQKWCCPTSEVRPPEPWHLLINFQKEISCHHGRRLSLGYWMLGDHMEREVTWKRTKVPYVTDGTMSREWGHLGISSPSQAKPANSMRSRNEAFLLRGDLPKLPTNRIMSHKRLFWNTKFGGDLLHSNG